MVVLKRLADAVRDGDRVLAVVRGSAVNQVGTSSGLTLPTGPAQQALLRQALASARLQPADIDYVEAHSAGTPLGDAIELESLGQVFSDRGNSAPVVLGSVKTNLGHLEAAAGVAGFIKTVLAVHHGYIPRHLNFKELTPYAPVEMDCLSVASSGRDWPVVDRPRRAGVSSFGVSGSNAHVVIEQAPDVGGPVVDGSSRRCRRWSSRVRPWRGWVRWAAALADWMEGAGAGVSVGGGRAHAQPPPDSARQVRHGVCRRSRRSDRRVAGGGRRATRARGGAPARRAVRVGCGVRVFGAGFAVGRDGPPIVG